MGASVSPLANAVSGFEGLFNDSSTFKGFMNNLQQLGQGIGGIGRGIGTMAGVPSAKSMSPTGSIAPSPIASPVPATASGAPSLGTITNPNPAANPVATLPSMPSTATIPSIPSPGSSILGQNFTSNLTDQVGSGLSDTITNYLNSLGPNSQQAVQQIINANAPNVQRGSDMLNTGLAASGISPSSSVSAIENANYMSGVQQQNLAELAQTYLGEQSLTGNMLQNLEAGQQQAHAESSPWNIISNVLGGIGGIFGL